MTLDVNSGGGPRVVVSTAAFHARDRGSVPGLGGLKETKLFLPHPRVKVSIVGSLRDREVACSASDRQGSNFDSCVWRTVSSQSSHHPQEVLLAQFSLYVHKGGLKPDSFHFLFDVNSYSIPQNRRTSTTHHSLTVSDTVTRQNQLIIYGIVGKVKLGHFSTSHHIKSDVSLSCISLIFPSLITMWIITAHRA